MFLKIWEAIVRLRVWLKTGNDLVRKVRGFLIIPGQWRAVNIRVRPIVPCFAPNFPRSFRISNFFLRQINIRDAGTGVHDGGTASPAI